MRIKTLQELEKEQIRKVLEKTYWNMEKTARLLQITVSQLKKKSGNTTLKVTGRIRP